MEIPRFVPEIWTELGQCVGNADFASQTEAKTTKKSRLYLS